MRCAKVCIFLFMMAELTGSVQQRENMQKNGDSNSPVNTRKETNMEDLYKKIDNLILEVELNHKKAKNIIRNSIAPVKKELTTLINDLKLDMNNRIDNINSEIKKVRSEVITFNSDITHEIEKVHSKVNNFNSNITSENKIKVSVCENKLGALKAEIDLLKPAPFYPRNCAELLYKSKPNGIQTVYPFKQSSGDGISVICDQYTEGGGWTVFQNRDYLVFRENFYKNWNAYSMGFGDLSGEFWLGLKNIHTMTKYTKMELRIDLEDEFGERRFAKYESFSIENSSAKFLLNVGKHSGDASDELSYHNNRKFSTFDQDNDASNKFNCAKQSKGAWWYGTCYSSNLNGFPFIGNYTDEPPFYHHGIVWTDFRGLHNSLRKCKMMFRPQ